MDSLFGRHRRLLFRSYLLLVAGLLTVAAVLDYGFGRLQSTLQPEDQWLAASWRLIESAAADASPDRRDAVVARLADEVGFGIRILARDEVVSTAGDAGVADTLIDADGNRYLLRDSQRLDALIRLGPVAEPRESLLLRLLPPIFYLSLFVIVGIWLRPLLGDLNLITAAARRFAADYREPLSTASQTTQLSELASNLDDMSARLSGLIQSQKELIAALSHEMRTPLARIRFALAVIGDDGDDRLKDQLDEINDDVQEIDQLIATMLSYARLDHPDLRMNWQRVPLEPWLAQLEDKGRQPGKSLVVERGSTAESAWMDPRLMGLALSNLLANASRYAAATVHCRFDAVGDACTITVEDDGPGIPEAERETVFKAFTRLDDSRNRETGGYGLGLAIVARIAALHGGAISVSRSAALGGACFELTWREPERG